MCLTGGTILDLDVNEAGYTTYSPWSPDDHKPYDAKLVRKVHCADTASVMLFGVTETGHTATVRVREATFPIWFRLHDDLGTPFESRDVGRLRRMVRAVAQDELLEFEEQHRYQSSGFVADGSVGAVDRPVRKRLLFGRVMMRTVRSFELCKYATRDLGDPTRKCPWQLDPILRSTSAPERSRWLALWRPEELFVGEAINKWTDHLGLIDSKWVQVNRYGRKSLGSKGRGSHDDYDVWTRADQLQAVDSTKVAPVRFVSIDIETHTDRLDHRKERLFCDATYPRDRIIQIGMVFGTLGDPAAPAGPKIILCLDDTDPTPDPDVEVMTFGSRADHGSITDRDEAALLNKFAELVTLSNVRVILGYNLLGFDYAYMVARARKLGANSFWYLGPMPRMQAHVRTHTNRKGYAHTDLEIPGMCTVDMMDRVQELPGTGLPSYKLHDVAERFLGEGHGKVDLDIATMMALWEVKDDGAGGRARIAHYCIVDCMRPAELCVKLDTLAGLQQLSSIAHTTTQQLLSRGISSVVATYAAWTAHRHGYVLTTKRLDGSSMDSEGDGFEGALVLDAKGGVHHDVHTLDFASLYPSIMHSFNICWSTRVDSKQADVLLRRYPDGDLRKYKVVAGQEPEVFVSNADDDNGGLGLIPIMIHKLLKERRQCRSQGQNIRQLQLKIMANSIYGFTGCKGPTACKAVASTVTFIGRLLLSTTQQEVLAVRDEEGRQIFDVIYGDTDRSPPPACARRLVRSSTRPTRHFKNAFDHPYVPTPFAQRLRPAPAAVGTRGPRLGGCGGDQASYGAH